MVPTQTLPSLEEALQNQEVVSSNRPHDRGGRFSGRVWSQDSLSAHGASSQGGVLSWWSWYEGIAIIAIKLVYREFGGKMWKGFSYQSIISLNAQSYGPIAI